MKHAIDPARALLAAALLLGAGGAMAAQGLQDPTRPPAAVSSFGTAPAAASGGPQLQTILIARQAGGRHLAVIDGETVQLGDDFHGARVTRIAENEVVLVRGGERQVLRLYAQDTAGITPVGRAARR